MGLFDRFKAGPKSEKKARPGAEAKWADRIERRAQNYDRQEAIQTLSEMGTAEAAEILLKRFTFQIDPSITDHEERDAAFRGIVRAGSLAIAPVRAFAARAESLAWPMKIMKELVDESTYVDELLLWLARWDTDYSKFVDPKVQLLAELGEHTHSGIRGEVERFLDDVNEPARFHAVATLLAQGHPDTAAPLVNLLLQEESVRVRTKIAEGLASQSTVIDQEHRDGVRKMLPSAFTVDATGHVVKR